jgi:hypothetical protein
MTVAEVNAALLQRHIRRQDISEFRVRDSALYCVTEVHAAGHPELATSLEVLDEQDVKLRRPHALAWSEPVIMEMGRTGGE